MKKNDLIPKPGEERRGFWKIGYLENQDYARRMLELTHREIDSSDLDEVIEKAVDDNKQIYMDIKFNLAKEKNAVYSFFPTMQKSYHSNQEIFGGFYRMETEDRWRGVYLEPDTEILKVVLANQRQRSALEDYTYIYDYSHIAKLCNETFINSRSEEEWANYISGLFIKREKNGEIYTFPDGSYFPAEEKAKDGVKQYYWMENNDKPGAKQKGFGLSLLTEDELMESWADSQHKYTLDRLTFSNWEMLEEFVDEVATTAMPENWGRLSATNPETAYGHPVLKSYLQYTLIRLRDLDKSNAGYILREKDMVYYNTGLLNKFFRQIIVGAHLKREEYDLPGLGKRELEFYFDPYIIVSGHDTKFPTTEGLKDFPRIAQYFEKKEDVLYDASLEIMLNDEHIFEDGLKAGRIPIFREEYQRVKNSPEDVKNLHVRVQARVQIAIQRARLLAERNYKLAVPQYWKETGEVQFLLPLYMEEAEYTGRPQCALALRRVKSGSYYEGATILSLDMAYNNARLIAKPDVTWLNRENSLETPTVEACEIVLADRLLPMVIESEPVKTVSRPKEEVKVVQPVKNNTENQNKNGNGKQPENGKNSGKKPQEPAEEPNEEMDDCIPDDSKIGVAGILTDITSRPSGKGLKGRIFGCTGTVARNLLKNPVPHYTGGSLKVKIVEVNPQGNQYILEPIE